MHAMHVSGSEGGAPNYAINANYISADERRRLGNIAGPTGLPPNIRGAEKSEGPKNLGTE